MSGQRSGGAAMSAGGGAAAGAAAGSIIPGVGTVVGGLIGAGIGAGVFGDISGAADQAELEREKAQFAELQAQEIESRNAANEVIRDQAGYKSGLDFSATYAGSGHEGAGIGSQLEIKRQTDLQDMLAKRDADFQAAQLRRGAALQMRGADMTQEAGYLNAFGTVLGGASRIATTPGVIKSGGPSSLPPPPGSPAAPR